MNENLITIQNCRIENKNKIVIENFSWKMKSKEAWLVIGPNGGGKADFINALASSEKIIPNTMKNDGDNGASIFSSTFDNSVEIVSLEKAALLIEEERANDESEYIEGGVDIGRTGRIFIAEGVCGKIKKNEPLPDIVRKIEAYPAIKLCGVEKILDRGLKYMSTGEIRRTLLARALVSGKRLIILSDPFAGLDVESRTVLLDFFTTLVGNQGKENSGSEYPHILLSMERWYEIPDSISNVIEFREKDVSFCGTRSDYENLLKEKEISQSKVKETARKDFSEELQKTIRETEVLHQADCEEKEVLIEMNHVNVGWDNHKVLSDLNWKLVKGEHWLIRGPNGSGKTTFLELITGDNMQVFCNDVRLFGKKRGSGESIWDIKQKMGIVSYRLHVEYRMVNGTSLQNVIISGFRDSIGLYGDPTDVEIAAARKWLRLGGFEGRENESFGAISYGEQRAILILRSAVKCPPILILDEPCHGLDEQYREKILHLLEVIAENGSSTMLHVTHDPSEVSKFEHNVLELHPNENPMYKIIQI